jgi:hypothetical protein
MNSTGILLQDIDKRACGPLNIAMRRIIPAVLLLFAPVFLPGSGVAFAIDGSSYGSPYADNATFDPQSGQFVQKGQQGGGGNTAARPGGYAGRGTSLPLSTWLGGILLVLNLAGAAFWRLRGRRYGPAT